jgi:hypothetical protein
VAHRPVRLHEVGLVRTHSGHVEELLGYLMRSPV